MPIKTLTQQTENKALQHIGDALELCEDLRQRIKATLNEDAPVNILKGNTISSDFSEELKELSFPKLAIMRPSFLIGNRKEKRASETIGIFVFKLLSPLLLGPLKKMKPIHSATVAKAMIKISKSENDQIVFESNEIVKLSIS